MAKRVSRTESKNVQTEGYDDYSNEVHGTINSGGVPPSDRMINVKENRVSLLFPPSDGKTTWFRPMNCLDPKNPSENLLGGRVSDAQNDQHPWIIRVPVAKYIGVGDNRFSFILCHPNKRQEVWSKHPFVKLFNAVNKAADGEFGTSAKWDPVWASMVKRKKTQKTPYSGTLQKPGSVWFVQAFVYHCKEAYINAERKLPFGMLPDDPLPLLQLSDSAGLAIMEGLNKKKPESKVGEVKSPDDLFQFGSAVGKFSKKNGIVRGGLFVGVFWPQHEKHSFAMDTEAGVEGYNKLFGNDTFCSFSGSITDIPPYEARFKQKLAYHKIPFTPDLDKEATDQIFNKWTYWFDRLGKQGDQEVVIPGLLKILSIEEQCELIAQAYSDVAGVLKFGWFGHDEFFTPAVKKILAKSVTVPSGKKSDSIGEEDEEEEKPKKKKKASLFNSKKKKKEDDEESEDEEFEDDDSEDEDEVEEESEDDDSEDDDSEEEEEESEDDASEEESEDDDSEDDDLEDDDSEEEEEESEDDASEEESEDDDSEDDDSEDDDSEEEDDDVVAEEEEEEPKPKPKKGDKKTSTLKSEVPDAFAVHSSKKEKEEKAKMETAKAKAAQRSSKRGTPAEEPKKVTSKGGQATRKKKPGKK